MTVNTYKNNLFIQGFFPHFFFRQRWKVSAAICPQTVFRWINTWCTQKGGSNSSGFVERRCSFSTFLLFRHFSHNNNKSDIVFRGHLCQSKVYRFLKHLLQDAVKYKLWYIGLPWKRGERVLSYYGTLRVTHQLCNWVQLKFKFQFTSATI